MGLLEHNTKRIRSKETNATIHACGGKCQHTNIKRSTTFRLVHRALRLWILIKSLYIYFCMDSFFSFPSCPQKREK